MKQFKDILNKPFAQDIMNSAGELYFVGGAVRDFYLDKEPKDIDLIVAKLELIHLKEILFKYGHVDIVGEAFGVIVFKEFETGFSCEIALPRRDSKNKSEKGHKSIEVQSDPFMPIESDLKRRDFTINSFCLNQKLDLIDPFKGLKDLKRGIIKATDKDTFIDDPLRLLRAIQFSARFDFDIEESTFNLILKHKLLIREIVPERILIEFQKVFDKKGNIYSFYKNLTVSGLREIIFDVSDYKPSSDFKDVKYLSEFLYLLIRDIPGFPDNCWNVFFERRLKIDNKTFDELRVLNILYHSRKDNFHASKNRMDIFRCLKIAPWFWDSEFFVLPGIDKLDFDRNILPKSMKDFAIRGEDFMKLGYEGQAIGEKQQEILSLLFEGKLKNTKSSILNYLKIKK